MDKQISLAAAAALLLAGAASAQNVILPPAAYPATTPAAPVDGAPGSVAHYAWADVLRVDPVYETVSVTRSRRECRDVRVTERERGNGSAGAVLGAIVGGVLGNTVGKGDGRKAATVAGAVAGGAVGHGVATRGDGDYTHVETRCDDVPEVSREQRVNGYDVEYRYQGDVYMSRLAYDPGERLRVRVSVTPAE